MLRLIRNLFGRGVGAGSGETAGEDDATRSVSVGGDEFYGANSDIIDGVQFSATLQLRTPLSVLIHHGEVFKGPPSQAPEYGGQADGIWLAHLRGSVSAMLKQGRTHASEAGPVDDEAYVPFLKAFRTIVEGPGDEVEKLRELHQLPKVSPNFAGFWRKLERNVDGFPESFFYMQLTAIEGIGRATAQRLFEAGFRSLDQLRSAPESALLVVKGVGSTMVAKIKSEAARTST